MKKLFLVVIATLLSFSLFGCAKSNVDMSYLKIPTSINLVDNQNGKVNLIKKELKNLKNNNKDKESQDKLLRELFVAVEESTVKIDDKEFINKIKNSSGSVITNGTKYASNKALYDLQLNYNDIKVNENNGVDLIKEGYVFNIWIYEDKMAGITKYDETAQNKAIIVGVTLDDDTFSYIKEYYNSKLK